MEDERATPPQAAVSPRAAVVKRSEVAGLPANHEPVGDELWCGDNSDSPLPATAGGGGASGLISRRTGGGTRAKDRYRPRQGESRGKM